MRSGHSSVDRLEDCRCIRKIVKDMLRLMRSDLIVCRAARERDNALGTNAFCNEHIVHCISDNNDIARFYSFSDMFAILIQSDRPKVRSVFGLCPINTELEMAH